MSARWGIWQAARRPVQDSQGDKGCTSATNFRPTAVRVEVMHSTEIASATNFRPTAVCAEVMGPTESASATNFCPTAVRTGVMGSNRNRGCD